MKRCLGLLVSVVLTVAAVLAVTVSSSAADVGTGERAAEPAVRSTGEVFEYVTGGYWVKSSADMSFGDVVKAADAGTTIKMLADYTIESSIDGAIATVNKKLTLDMCGHTFTIRNRYDSAKDFGQPSVHIATSQGFTVKNGKLVAGHVTSSYQNKAYPFFLMTANKAKLNLENVSTYLGTIAYNWGAEQVELNVVGGQHYAYFQAYGCDGGLFNSRSGITVNAEEATFMISERSWLIASMHQNADADKRSSVFNFYNCTIFTESDTTNIVKYASEYTEIYFDKCRIDGGIMKPTVTSGESNKGIGAAKDGSIVFGYDTLFSAALDYDGRVTPAEGYVRIDRLVMVQVGLFMPSGNLYTGFSIGADQTITKFFTNYSIADPSSLQTATISWYDRDGKLITTTEAGVGSYVIPITLDEYGYESYDWYDVIYDGWSTTRGGAAEESILVSGNLSLYQTEGTVRARIAGAMYNLSLMGNVQTNIYFPAEAPDNVEILGVYQNRGAAESGTNALGCTVAKNALGDSYRCYVVGYAGASALSTPNEVWVKLSVTHGGKTSFAYQSYSLSALAYIKTMLADSEAEASAYPVTAHEMVANIVRYSYVLANTVGMAQDQEIVSLYNKYSSLTRPIDNTTDSDFPEPTVSLGAAASYIESITFEVGSYQPRYRISFRKDAHVTDARLSLVGWYAAGRGQANWMKQSYGYSGADVLYYDSLGQYVNSAGKVTNEKGTVQSGKTAGALTGELAIVYFEAIQIYNIDEDLTVSLTLSDRTRVEGKYNFDYYYNGIKESVGNDTLVKVREFLKVMREYGDSVVRHAFDTGKVPLDAMENNIVNYKDFGAVGDGVTNDFAAIKKTHEYANEMGYKVEADPDATYYIGRTFGEVVEVRTDTDWRGATFIIDDKAFGSQDVDRQKHIFVVTSDHKTETYTAVASTEVGRVMLEINKAGGIKADSFTRLDLGLGYPALVYLINENHNSYIRYGENQDAGSAQRELVKIDENGNVDESTPLLFDYEEITKIQVVRTDDAPIVVGYGRFITKANAAPRQYNYYYRGILVQRSNTTVTDIDHKIVDEGESGAPYSGFISASYCDAVMVLDSVLSAHKAYKLEGDDHNTMGSYDLSPQHPLPSPVSP